MDGDVWVLDFDGRPSINGLEGKKRKKQAVGQPAINTAVRKKSGTHGPLETFFLAKIRLSRDLSGASGCASDVHGSACGPALLFLWSGAGRVRRSASSVELHASSCPSTPAACLPVCLPVCLVIVCLTGHLPWLRYWSMDWDSGIKD